MLLTCHKFVEECGCVKPPALIIAGSFLKSSKKYKDRQSFLLKKYKRIKRFKRIKIFLFFWVVVFYNEKRQG